MQRHVKNPICPRVIQALLALRRFSIVKERWGGIGVAAAASLDRAFDSAKGLGNGSRPIRKLIA